MRRIALLLPLIVAAAPPAFAQRASPVTADPIADPAHPADMAFFVLSVGDSAMNALLYLASGRRPHPTLLLLHGFPGYEQNLDLAQAARRAGWNVMTLHYRGSWGSPGAFSFGNAAEDAHAALAYLRRPDIVVRYRIDPTRIAVAGHSMGGFMAADAAADDKGVIGLFLIDAWDIGRTAAGLSTPKGRLDWHANVVSELPPLAGTSESALTQEMAANVRRFSLLARIAAYGNRPLAVYGASRGNGPANSDYMRTAREAGNVRVSGTIWQTDHPFSDKRIALSKALVGWLDGIGRRRH